MTFSRLLLLLVVTACYFAIGELVSWLQITVTDADVLVEEQAYEPLVPSTDQELQEAIAAGCVTVDQAIQMHDCRINWHIDLEGRSQ